MLTTLVPSARLTSGERSGGRADGAPAAVAAGRGAVLAGDAWAPGRSVQAPSTSATRSRRTSVRGGGHGLLATVLGERRDIVRDPARPERGDHRHRGVERGEAGDARLNRRATDQKAVAVDVPAERRRVDDGHAFAGADQLQDVLAAFGELAHLGHADPEGANERRRPRRRDQLVPEPVEALDDRHALRLLLLRDGDD